MAEGERAAAALWLSPSWALRSARPCRGDAFGCGLGVLAASPIPQLANAAWISLRARCRITRR